MMEIYEALRSLLQHTWIFSREQRFLLKHWNMKIVSLSITGL